MSWGIIGGHLSHSLMSLRGTVLKTKTLRPGILKAFVKYVPDIY